MESPALHTERLVLLPLGPDDLDEMAALYGDAEVMADVAGGTRTRTETAEALDDVAASWRKLGYGLWAIRDATTGAFLGEGGLQPVPADGPLDGVGSSGSGQAVVDFGFTLCRRAWGHGYASEATTAILVDAWQRFDGPVIHAAVVADNEASIEVLRKLGFARQGTLDHEGETHQIWSIRRP